MEQPQVPRKPLGDSFVPDSGGSSSGDIFITKWKLAMGASVNTPQPAHDFLTEVIPPVDYDDIQSKH